MRRLCCPVSDFAALCANDDDLAALRRSVRDFLAADRAAHGWEPAVDCWLSQWDPAFSGRLADAGFVGLTIPVAYGGRGLGYLHRYVVTEELLAHGAPVAAHWIADRQVAPALLAYGSESQRHDLLPRIAAGRLYSAIGMSEQGAGSDLAAVTTRATPTGDGWTLTGSKLWTSGAHLADQVVVLARTSPPDPAHRHAGFSQFIVRTDSPGVTIAPIVLMNGEHHFNEVRFEDVALTADDVLGEIGDGWRQVTSELAFERSGPERFLSTATLLFAVLRELRAHGADDRTVADVGDLVARLVSLRQLSVAVARDLCDGRDATARAALVKDLGTRFEQDSVDLAADLLAGVEPAAPLRDQLATARVHAPLFTLRGGTNEVLRGVVAKSSVAKSSTGSDEPPGDHAELRALVDQVGKRSWDARSGAPRLPEDVDVDAWRALEDTGLAGLLGSGDGGPAETAVVLHGLARRLVAVPIAETDVLATWLASVAGLDVPAGPLTVAVADGCARDVTWPQLPTVVLAHTAAATRVALLPPSAGAPVARIGGEPVATAVLDPHTLEGVDVSPAVHAELLRRGAWARCVQMVGAFDAAVDLTATHVRDREQFGRPLAAFQAVQHQLAGMRGEVERARAVTALATAAVEEGFDGAAAEYAVAAAKVAVGRAASAVSATAHQLHGAIGVTREHRLWLATMRARAWSDDFDAPARWARTLGRLALAAEDPWDLVIGNVAGQVARD